MAPPTFYICTPTPTLSFLNIYKCTQGSTPSEVSPPPSPPLSPPWGSRACPPASLGTSLGRGAGTRRTLVQSSWCHGWREQGLSLCFPSEHHYPLAAIALGCPRPSVPGAGRSREESQTPGSFQTQHHPSKRSLQRGLLGGRAGGDGWGAGCWLPHLQPDPGLDRDSAR